MGRDDTNLLVGRVPELTQFGARLAAAIDGHGSFVLVEGEPGIGKTTLVRALRREAEQRQVGICAGAAAPFDDGRPLGVLAEALGLRFAGEDPRRVAVAHLLRGVDDDAGLRSNALYTVHDAVLGLVEELAAERPQLIVLEDLHWADAATFSALWMLLRRLHRMPVLVAATTRTWPVSPELAALRARFDGTSQSVIRLGPLDEASLDELVAGLVRGPAGPALRRRLSGAHGNPFVVSTVLRSLQEQGQLDRVDGTIELVDTTARSASSQPLFDRLVDLPARDVELLSRLAVLGRSATVAELAAISGREADDVVASLEPALRQGLLLDDGGGVGFRHGLVREAIIEQLEPTLRAHVHHEIGRALAARGAPASVVATHLAVGAAVGDAQAIAWLRRAANEQGRTNPLAAARWLEQAVELAADSSVEFEVLVEYVRVLLLAHQLREAESAARRALGLVGAPGLRAELMAGLGQARAMSGDVSGAFTHLEQAAAVDGLSSGQRARVYAELAAARVLSAHCIGAAEAASIAISEGGVAGLPATAAVGWSARCRLQAIGGDYDDAILSARRALSLAELGGDRNWLVFHRLMAGLAYTAADRSVEGRQHLEQGCREAVAVGDVIGHLRCLAVQATHSYFEGDLDDVVDCTELAAGIGADVDAMRLLAVTYAMHGLAALLRDEPDVARLDLARGLDQIAHRRSRDGVVHLSMLQVRLAIVTGQSDAELRAAVSSLSDVGARLLGEAPAVVAWLSTDLLEAALLVGDDALAADIVTAMEKNAVKTATASDRMMALACRGMADGELSLLIAAAEESCLSPRLLERARIHERAGRMAAAQQHPRTVSLLSDALRYWDQIGGTRGVRVVSEFAQANGVRLANRPTRRPQLGWDSLTAAEREVLALVGQGLSNPAIAERLFVSRRTIETHVSRLYAKLGIANRVLLAAEAQRRGLRPSD